MDGYGDFINVENEKIIEKEYNYEIYIDDNYSFEILLEKDEEKDEEIDIQSIKELEKLDFDGIGGRANLDIKSAKEIGLKINELIKAVKKLDKK